MQLTEPALGGRQVEIVVRSTIPMSLLIENVAKNFEEDWPRFAKLPELGKGTGPIAIIAGGPSVNKEIEFLKKFPGPIMGCGTTHDYLIESGVIPNYQVIVDPSPIVLDWVKKPHQDVVYLIASQCDPVVFRTLKEYQIRMWHSFVTDGEEGNPFIDFKGEPFIPGGDFVVARAMPLACVLGHKNIHLYGFDCSFPLDCTSQHAYEYTWEKEDPCWVTVEHTGEKFATTPGLMAQLRTFQKILCLTKDMFTITMHGESLAVSMCCKPRELKNGDR